MAYPEPRQTSTEHLAVTYFYRGLSVDVDVDVAVDVHVNGNVNVNVR
jgi:hypothetical protein